MEWMISLFDGEYNYANLFISIVRRPSGNKLGLCACIPASCIYQYQLTWFRTTNGSGKRNRGTRKIIIIFNQLFSVDQRRGANSIKGRVCLSLLAVSTSSLSTSSPTPVSEALFKLEINSGTMSGCSL